MCCPSYQSSSGGNSSSMYRISETLISVVSFPRSTSLMKCASTCICTISRAPRRTPHRILEYHSSSCARPSSGSSTKSANGFSSKTRENWLLSLVQLVTWGVMLRNILNPTCAASAASPWEQQPSFDAPVQSCRPSRESWNTASWYWTWPGNPQ